MNSLALAVGALFNFYQHLSVADNEVTNIVAQTC